MRSGLRLSSKVVLDETGGARDDAHCEIRVGREEREGLGECETASP